MRALGLGITNYDLEHIPRAGSSFKRIGNEDLVNRLKGKILLQVESKGEAWYVSPVDGKRHLLGKPDDALEVMKKLGLGITNRDLAKIRVGEL